MRGPFREDVALPACLPLSRDALIPDSVPRLGGQAPMCRSFDRRTAPLPRRWRSPSAATSPAADEPGESFLAALGSCARNSGDRAKSSRRCARNSHLRALDWAETFVGHMLRVGRGALTEEVRPGSRGTAGLGMSVGYIFVTWCFRQISAVPVTAACAVRRVCGSLCR